MKLTAFGAAVVVACAQTVVGLMINTPLNVVECQPVLLSWQSDPGTPPYYLSILPGGQPSAPAIKTFEPITDTTYTWKVDIQAGVEITISLKDNTGAQAYTDKFTIQAGGDRSCEQGANSPAPTGSGTTGPAPAASTPTGSSSAGPAASGSSTPSSASASGSSRPTGSQAAVASVRPNSAVRMTSVTGGVAGFFAVVGALVF